MAHNFLLFHSYKTNVLIHCPCLQGNYQNSGSYRWSGFVFWFTFETNLNNFLFHLHNRDAPIWSAPIHIGRYSHYRFWSAFSKRPIKTDKHCRSDEIKSAIRSRCLLWKTPGSNASCTLYAAGPKIPNWFLGAAESQVPPIHSPVKPLCGFPRSAKGASRLAAIVSA